LADTGRDRKPEQIMDLQHRAKRKEKQETEEKEKEDNGLW
jgi:hypothetical protein